MWGFVRTFSLICGVVVFLLGTAPASAEPSRIVSLNPCLDAVLVQVADRAQIAAVSHYARDPHASSIADIAADLPITYETAEEVIARSPDLVMTSRHSAIATRNALARLGIKTILFDVPDTVAASQDQIREVAALVGHPERGAALVDRIDQALAEAKPRSDAPPLSAALIEPNGFSVGAETLSDELLRRTGFENVAARYGVGRSGLVPLEKLIANPPSVLFLGQPEGATPEWAERVVRHPAMRRLSGRVVRAEFPQKLMYCGGAVLIEGASILAQARLRATAGAP